MSYSTGNPIHEFRVVRVWKESSILLLFSLWLLLWYWYALVELLLLFLLTSSLFFLSPLSLCAVVYEEGQSSTQSQDDE